MKAIEKAHTFSEERVAQVRSDLAGRLPSDALVVTCGSYARRDASAESDMDYFCIQGATDSVNEATDAAVREVVQRVVGKLPSQGGAFAANLPKSEFTQNVGGYDDTNQKITRRILFLLEGDHLFNQTSFEDLRQELVEFYVRSTPDCHQLAFYLLNDIVRYWRTIAVDYAHKTSGKDAQKPWGVRNIKLVYSRKLIYASGIFSVALTADRTVIEKARILELLFSKTPLQRIEYVCGSASSTRLFQLYDQFLEKLDDKSCRDHLDSLSADQKHEDETFRFLKNESHYFSRELMGLLGKTFHASHPIHMALIF